MQTTKQGFTPHRWAAMAGLATAGFLTACAPALRVTLLPEADGRASAVLLQTERGETVLDAPYQQAKLRRIGPAQVVKADPDKTNGATPRLFELMPAAQLKYSLLFELGSTDLTPESLAMLPEVLQQAHAVEGGEIVVVGHTDNLGDAALNDRLSLARAQALRKQLIAEGFEEHRVRAVGRGSRDPLPGTEGDAVQPRNRRVELLVR